MGIGLLRPGLARSPDPPLAEPDEWARVSCRMRPSLGLAWTWGPPTPRADERARNVPKSRPMPRAGIGPGLAQRTRSILSGSPTEAPTLPCWPEPRAGLGLAEG